MLRTIDGANRLDQFRPLSLESAPRWTGMCKLLGRYGLGYIVFDSASSAVDWNDTAQTKLNITSVAKCSANVIASAFRDLVKGIPYKHTPNTLTWVVQAHLDGTPSVLHEKSDLVPLDSNIVLLLDRETRPNPNLARMQQMFGLTNAEADVLAAIACGHTLLEIASKRRLSRATIRSHLASLFDKTNTDRQASLIALVDSFSVLP